MWEPEKEFEILEEAGQYDLENEINDEFPCLELEPSADEDEDENEDNDVLGYEGDFCYDEEDD